MWLICIENKRILTYTKRNQSPLFSTLTFLSRCGHRNEGKHRGMRQEQCSFHSHAVSFPFCFKYLNTALILHLFPKSSTSGSSQLNRERRTSNVHLAMNGGVRLASLNRPAASSKLPDIIAALLVHAVVGEVHECVLNVLWSPVVLDGGESVYLFKTRE